eukprot:Protomagalhaensia_wolfi_Nauph_80__2465@NODE_2636_length_1032_cov_199_284995_g2065_i0_p1_GENE_NODE_2636_length_1032_cov_199_284995_g2065_i0NODE_2636_length_1032_cov_199_284995_g2065_i0_p1_ORF_typecomplete_len231_score19_03Luteo_Vpg/PF01659_16/7_3e02Luteo_Vpg/PF01659_16/0_058Luteo_Vpg/PF01659_16/9_8e02_NODE_2636_length_1032_cov_199_284995_g2065_i0240932
MTASRSGCCYRLSPVSEFLCCAQPASRDVDDQEVCMSEHLSPNESLGTRTLDWTQAHEPALQFRLAPASHGRTLPVSVKLRSSLTRSSLEGEEDPSLLVETDSSLSSNYTDDVTVLEDERFVNEDLSFLESPLTSDVRVPSSTAANTLRATPNQDSPAGRLYHYWKRNPLKLFRPATSSGLLSPHRLDSSESALVFFNDSAVGDSRSRSSSSDSSSWTPTTNLTMYVRSK